MSDSTFSHEEPLRDVKLKPAELRQLRFRKVDRERLAEQVTAAEVWPTGKYSHVFKLVLQRFHYFRRLAPTL